MRITLVEFSEIEKEVCWQNGVGRKVPYVYNMYRRKEGKAAVAAAAAAATTSS